MSTYPVKKLLDLWAQGRLTLEQAIGHILQRLLDHEARLRALEKAAGLPPQETES
ncbi:MAG: hypothetical protein R3C14_12595 [Caldilineaceae bacterium]